MNRTGCKDDMRTLEERFWSHVDVKGDDDCWEWKAKKVEGYGQIRLGSASSGSELAHRVSYQLAYGPIPPGKIVCHRCDNRGCVNPAHLFLGSYGDNSRDMVEKNRSMKGERHWNAKLTEAQVIAIRAEFIPGSTDQLAEKYGVDRNTIEEIINHRRWIHVP